MTEVSKVSKVKQEYRARMGQTANKARGVNKAKMERKGRRVRKDEAVKRGRLVSKDLEVREDFVAGKKVKKEILGCLVRASGPRLSCSRKNLMRLMPQSPK